MEQYNPWQRYERHRRARVKEKRSPREWAWMMAGTMGMVLLFWAAAMA